MSERECGPINMRGVVTKVFALALTLSAAMLVHARAAQHPAVWAPPPGVPAPSFGIMEIAPRFPSRWTNAVDGFYFVAQGANATDHENPNGWPARPRMTIPTILEAGSVVQVVGTYATAHRLDRNPILARGTAERPVFLRGTSPDVRPTFTQDLVVRGSYLIVEYVKSDLPRDATNVAVVARADGPSHHIAFRHSELVGDLGQVTSAGIAAVGFDEARGVEDVVFYDLDVHDHGNLSATTDVDAHCSVVGAFVRRFWLLDSRLHGCAGDGFQANPGQGAAALTRQSSTRYIYLGRNTVYANRQSGLWSKNVTDIIFSQNTIYGIRRSGSSPMGQCIGGQYGPVRMWIIFNTLHDCETGVAVASTSGMGEGTEVYVLGNVIYDIQLTGGPNDPSNSSSRAAIALWDIPHRYIVDNTIWRTHSGIKNDGSGLLTISIHGNIIGAATDPAERDIWVPDQRGFDDHRSELTNNLVAENRISWGRSSRRCSGCDAAKPKFVNEAEMNFRYAAASSLGIDASSEHAAYATFEKLYGIDIRVDRDGQPRPQGRAWDVGAYEWRTAGAGMRRSRSVR